MEFSDVIKNRVSCRRYNGGVVEQDLVDKILNAMILAPTAGHLQAYRVKVFIGGGRKAEAIEKSGGTGCSDVIEKIGETAGQAERVKGAGAAIVFFAVPKDASKYGERGEKVFALQDATIACSYAQLAACDLGLASLWIGAFDEKRLREVCGVEGSGEPQAGDAVLAGLEPVSILILGYSDEELKRAERKDLKNLLI